MFEVARNFAHFFAHESCGFCTPCRVGTALVRDVMDKIAAGRGTRYEINELMRLYELLRRTSHCGLGQTRRSTRFATPGRSSARPTSGACMARFRAGGRSRGRAWRRRARITGRDDADAHLGAEA